MNYTTKDSGERKEYSSGMRRDNDKDKPRYDLITYQLLNRLGLLLARGAEKYGDNNWQLANSEEELARFKASAFRHLVSWMYDKDLEEDHGVAVVFNIMAYEFIKEKMKKNE